MKKSKVLSKINPLFLKGVAHRGLHTKDNHDVSENSMKAFELAVKNNIPIELDIHLTKDNDLVVIHDEDLKRLTDKEGIVEHLTLKELQENYRLLDGSVIPSFNEVLDMVDEKVPMIVELKVYEKNYKPLAAKAYEVLSQRIRDKKNFMLISFDPRSLWPMKKLGLIRLLLATPSHEYVYNLFRHTVEGVDLDQEFFKRKKFQNYHKRYLVNSWTIETKEQLKQILPYVDTATFQYVDKKDIEELLSK